MKDKMPFGKYKGTPISELPDWYLTWALEHLTEISGELWIALKREWDARQRGSSTDMPSPSSVPDGVSLEIASQIISEGRRALTRRHHPDIGGDPSVMLSVNVTYDFLVKRIGRLLDGGRAA